MPRAPQGGAYEIRGRFFARVTIAAGQRKAIALPWATSSAQAEERARAIQDLVTSLVKARQSDFVVKVVEVGATDDPARWADLVASVGRITAGKIPIPPKPKGEGTSGGMLTVRQLGERWTSGELAKLYPDHVREKRSVDDDVGRFERHIYPVLGNRPVASVGLDDALDVMRRLPAHLSPASRRHVAQLLSRLFAMAVYPCRIIAASPLPRGFLPKTKGGKGKLALFPREEAQLLACTSVPLASRVLYGFLCREGTRATEATSLTWADLDLTLGTVRLDKNKTDDPRAWALDQGTAETLRRWKAMQETSEPSEHPFQAVRDVGHLADQLRAHLRLAGITRPELFETTEQRRRLRAHDMRATFVSVAQSCGKSEAWITARTGHKSSAQVATYRRLAQTFQDVGESWFADMATAIPEIAAATTAAVAAATEPAPTEKSQKPKQSRKLAEVAEWQTQRIQKAFREVTSVAKGAESAEVALTAAHEGAPSTTMQPSPQPQPVDPVEAALAVALEGATKAGQWGVVATLAAELAARRTAREGAVTGNVVSIGMRGKR